MSAQTHTTGLSSMFGHDHELAARELVGTLSFIPGAPETVSVDLSVRSNSFSLLDKDVRERDRRDIERMVRKALDAAKYDQISFHGGAARTELVGPNIYDVEIEGELRLNGVRNELTIPAQVILAAAELRARGTFKIRQTDYDIVPVSFADGAVGVTDEVTVTFDLVAPLVRERRPSPVD